MRQQTLQLPISVTTPLKSFCVLLNVFPTYAQLLSSKYLTANGYIFAIVNIINILGKFIW